MGFVTGSASSPFWRLVHVHEMEVSIPVSEIGQVYCPLVAGERGVVATKTECEVLLYERGIELLGVVSD